MSRALPSFAALRAQLVRQSHAEAVHPERVTLGVAPIDARLGGGLARAALHELFAADPDDASAATGFAILLTLRASLDSKPVIWVREDRGCRNTGHLHAPGIAELGGDPDRFFTVHAPDALTLLRAGADIVKCGAVGAVVIEPWGKAPGLDLTASRRLALAAVRSGVMTLVVRSGSDPHPSAAQTRWRIASAPSRALTADAPGAAAFDIEMLRHRGGTPGFAARLEWNRDRTAFAHAPLSGSVAAVPAIGADRDDRMRAA